jgi:hypothetical protein
LYGTKFTVETDHEALKNFPKITDNMSRKVIRWALFANEFDFQTVFRPGVANQNADGLSRIPEQKEAITTSDQTQSIKALTTEMFLQEQEKDEFCKKAKKKCIKEQHRRTKFMEEYLAAETDGREHDKEHRENNENENDLDEEEQLKEFNNGLIGTADGKILVPESLREKILIRFHDSLFAGRKKNNGENSKTF